MRALAALLLSGLLMTLPLPGQGAPAAPDGLPDGVAPLVCPENAESWTRQSLSFPSPADPGVTVHVHALCAGSLDPTSPTAGPAAGPAAGWVGGVMEGVAASPATHEPNTDCESDAFRLTGWHWEQTVSFAVDELSTRELGFLDPGAVEQATTAAAGAWDAETGAALYGSTSTNQRVPATGFVADGVNQISFEPHPLAVTAVAVTSTFVQNGVAFESDGRYNPIWNWNTDGGAGFDFESVAAHEIGHTFGLGHPPDDHANDCLTMWAFVSSGSTHARTLGDGDILGLEAIYGA